MHRLKVFVPVHGIGVDHNLGVETVKVALIGNYQRVYLDQREIFLFKQGR